MKQYKGYYIDGIIFNNEIEIDDFIKAKAVERFITLNKIFSKHLTVEASIACQQQAEQLHNVFGFSWEEIEAFEIKAIA